MTYLLDTHYVIWAVSDPKKIPKRVKDILSDPVQEIIVSTISFWEISLKFSLGKLEFLGFSPEDIPEACLKVGFDILSLSYEDCSIYHMLKPGHHKDPFDRMLIWQAIRNNYTLISSDDIIRNYIPVGLNVFY